MKEFMQIPILFGVAFTEYLSKFVYSKDKIKIQYQAAEDKDSI